MWILVWKTLTKAFYQGRPTLLRVQPHHSGGWLWWLTQHPAPLSKHPFISSALQPTPPEIIPESPSSPASPSSLLGTPDIIIFFLMSLAPPVHGPMTFYPSPLCFFASFFWSPWNYVVFQWHSCQSLNSHSWSQLCGRTAALEDGSSTCSVCLCLLTSELLHKGPNGSGLKSTLIFHKWPLNTYHLPGSLAFLALNS